MSKQPPPAHTARAVGPCPTFFQISRTPRLRYPVWQHTFVSPSAFSRRAVVSYWREYVHEVLVNRLGGLSLPRKSVVRLTDRPDMTLDVYRGRKTTIQPIQGRPGTEVYLAPSHHPTTPKNAKPFIHHNFVEN